MCGFRGVINYSQFLLSCYLFDNSEKNSHSFNIFIFLFFLFVRRAADLTHQFYVVRALGLSDTQFTVVNLQLLKGI